MRGEIILGNLSHLPVWVGWREEPRNGDLAKIPYSPRTLREAESNNAATWATRGEAETWAITNRGGVGIVLSQLNGGDCFLCGIDLDTCRDPATETFQGWAQEVIDRFATYTEVSPSGTGAKLFFTHAGDDLSAIERLFDGKGGRQFKNGGGKHCPSIEIYRSGRYFTVTEESIGPTDILREIPFADLEWLIRNAGPKFAHKESQESSAGSDQSRSAKAFRKGIALKAAGLSYGAMRNALLADEDPEITEWARTKGLANSEREMHRIYDNGQAEKPAPIVAKPYVYRDPRSIPPRQWLHAGHYARKFLSATFAPGGLGKTSLDLVEALGMVVGQDLLKGATAAPLKVWYWNLEDPQDEIDRRIAAILLHYKIDPAAVDGRLFVNSEIPLVIATRARDATVVAEPAVNGLVSEIRRLQIDALIIDPFVSSHKVPENDNGAIDVVADAWSGIGKACNCAVELAHHVRKAASGSTSEITVDDGRGAGSLKDKGRSVRVLNVMSKEEAENVGIKPEQRKRYFRVDAGKANMKPPAESIVWRKLISVPLDNGTEAAEGDWVGVVAAWKMPGALEGITADDLLNVQKHIAQGKWREDPRAAVWAGKAVAKILGLNIREPTVRKRIAGMIRVWLETGALRIVTGQDENRHEREFVEVGEWAV